MILATACTRDGPMIKSAALIALVLSFALVPLAPVSASEDSPRTDAAASPSLHEVIAALDQEVFASFNQCNEPAELQRHASYFSSDVEFYHDTGGVTWTRGDMLANTAKYVCGKIRRELVADTLQVFPIKDHGAIAQGVHRFCRIDSGQCEGMADFVMVWRQQDDQWQMTRVLSYNHRPIHVVP